MDSLTQIVLGAACGEAVLGKKIGNRALLFGAIGGTIPDLDVYVGGWLYGNEIDAMLFHRGFMHSFLFSITASFFMGWFIFKLYNTGKRTHTTTQKNWIHLFFWSLFTHPILDCFTPYGTQIFAPFTNYRVAFNNIAVVDPAYTVPFLIALIGVMFFNRASMKRRLWLKWGIGLSSFYMLFTIGNKLYIDHIFKASLNEKAIEFNRFLVQPTLFSNILWYGIAETDDTYVVAEYSLLDTGNRFLNFSNLPKQRDLNPLQYQDIINLAWFSNGYYSIYKINQNEYQYNDLRYPLLDENDPNSSVFSFVLYHDDKRLNMRPFERNTEKINVAIQSIWKRAKGI
ncbi:metal-dependent hydrolase [Aestuariivivens sediminis]|uniref:metal-dependent hydrolase n=1 Tax=Aestuariivivens sediminis TaxID=2913557 RepID=UPI001F583FFA|nr:metal-dependent hydrolase [Aestuariivivens sediminis]